MNRSLCVCVLMVGGVWLAWAVPAAADATVRCPLEQATRTISDRLPQDWWSTPLVSGLSETKIAVIGGRPSLVCVYGESGSVQRYVPDGHRCEAKQAGFNCRAVAAAPHTHSTGQIDVPQTWAFDLDSGRVGRASEDIWFEADTADLLYLTPRNGAQMSVGDRSNRGLAGCSSGRYSPDRVSLRDIPVGSYVCVKTSEGRISQFRMNSISPESPKTLSIGYTTWDK